MTTTGSLDHAPTELILFLRCSPMKQVDRTKFYSMGYSVRSVQYRYTEWLKWNGTRLHGEWDQVLGVELYDHTSDTGRDFDGFENVNLASEPSMHSIIEIHHKLLVQNYGP